MGINSLSLISQLITQYFFEGFSCLQDGQLSVAFFLFFTQIPNGLSNTLFNSTIALSCILISLPLLYLVTKRPVSGEYRTIVSLLTLLIVLIGLTRLVEAYDSSQTAYLLINILKGTTAVAALASAVSIWPLVSKIIKSPAPEDLEAANLALQQQIISRNEVDEQNRKHTENLEQQIRKKNIALEETSGKLQLEIEKREASQSRVSFQASLLDQVNSAIIATDLDFNVTYWNRHAETIFGWKRHEVINSPVLELMTGSNKSRRGVDFLHNLKDKAGFSGEVYATHKNGNKIPLEIDCSPLIEAGNQQTGFIAVAVDITDHVTYENQLESEKAQAERLAIAKQEFLATMSHEIRTPLNVIIGMARLLSDNHPRNDQRDQLHSLCFSANHLLTIINDILDMAKIEAGKIQLERIDFSLNEVLDGLQSSFIIKVKEKGLNFSIEKEEGVPDMLVGDQVRLTQILNNLLSNAIKFTREGFVCVKIKAQRKSNGQYRLYFDIADSGIGISKDKLDQIFDNYTQAKADTTRQYGGTGLGLSICKRLVGLQGGKIGVKSEEGLGTTFSFSLDYQRSTQKKVQKERKTDFSYSLENVRLLLVDDDEANCMVASNFLEKMGISIGFAANGAEAVQVVQDNDFDIVLMDLQMPVMNGYRATEAIRKLGKGYQKLPIIALTADVVSDVQEKVLLAGMNDYLSKPFDPDQLNETIARHLKIKPEAPLQPKEEDIASLEQLLNTYQDDQEFTWALLSSLTKSFKELDHQLEDVIRQHDTVLLRSIIHKMQPTLTMMESHQLRKKLVQLRELLMEADTDEATREVLLSEIGILVQQSMQVLNRYQQEMKKETKLI